MRFVLTIVCDFSYGDAVFSQHRVAIGSTLCLNSDERVRRRVALFCLGTSDSEQRSAAWSLMGPIALLRAKGALDQNVPTEAHGFPAVQQGSTSAVPLSFVGPLSAHWTERVTTVTPPSPGQRVRGLPSGPSSHDHEPNVVDHHHEAVRPPLIDFRTHAPRSGIDGVGQDD